MKFLAQFSLLLIAAACSTNAKVISERILEGEKAAPNEATHMVYMRSLVTKDAISGASLISPSWVLTCGHCLLMPYFQIVVGTHNWKNLTNAQVRTISGYSNTFIHPKYGFNKGPNDIGLIKVDEPFTLNEFVTTIPLATEYQFGMSTVYGFGILTSGKRPTDLQKLNTDIITHEECLPLLQTVGTLDKDSNICTWTRSIGSTCAGDSGSPLVQWNGKEYWQVGVVSWGDTPCSETANPSALTKISNFKQWISVTMKGYDFL